MQVETRLAQTAEKLLQFSYTKAEEQYNARRFISQETTHALFLLSRTKSAGKCPFCQCPVEPPRCRESRGSSSSCQLRAGMTSSPSVGKIHPSSMPSADLHPWLHPEGIGHFTSYCTNSCCPPVLPLLLLAKFQCSLWAGLRSVLEKLASDRNRASHYSLLAVPPCPHHILWWG